MRLTTLLLGSVLSLSSYPILAGSGHDHGDGHSHSYTPVNQATAKINATNIVAALAERNKLDMSWKPIVASSVEQKEFKGNPEWVVVFVNDKITDVEKRTLYVFLTLGGDYIAANFTGK